MRYRVLPYRQGSASAKALATALGGKVLRLEGSTFIPRAGDVIINWGSTAFTDLSVMNKPDVVRCASNKLNFFQTMSLAGLASLPDFYTNQEDIPDEAFPVVCRTVLAGHSGDGIVIARTRSDLVSASLYIKYVKKQDEFRVHCGGVAGPVVIAVQRKARRLEHENPNWEVRNHNNGFVYARNGFTAPDSVIDAAKAAFTASGLDFGAVDVIYNNQQGRAYVLEINTAPGLEGQTVADYVSFFKSL